MSKRLLQCHDIHFNVANRARAVFAGLSLNINKGEFITLVGANGSGKSSLLRLINQQYRAQRGQIEYDYATQPIVTLNQYVGDSLFMELTVLENARLICQATQRDFANEMHVYLEAVYPQLALALHTPVQRLSGGEQQILAFALYMRQHPTLLLLDEHTSALDPKMAHKLMQLTADYIQQHQVTTLMTLHQPELALTYGDRLIALHDGEICVDVQGEQKRALTKMELLARCYPE